MPKYADISTKEWDKLHSLEYPPNVKATLENIHPYGRKAIVPAGEVCNWFTAIQQVNEAFIKKEMPFRLRLVQGGYPGWETKSYPHGYLVQLAKRVWSVFYRPQRNRWRAVSFYKIKILQFFLYTQPIQGSKLVQHAEPYRSFSQIKYMIERRTYWKVKLFSTYFTVLK